MPAKPMLDDVELEHVQKIEASDHQVLAQHGVPGLEGDFLQDLGRRTSRFSLVGVVTGAEASVQLKTLRLKFRDAEPVSFVSDIATATAVDKVIIEELGVRELAGKPARFEYQLTLRQYLPPPPFEEEEPTEIVDAEIVDADSEDEAEERNTEQVEQIANETGTLEVEVATDDGDLTSLRIVVDGQADDGEEITTFSTTPTDGVYTFQNLKAGTYNVRLELV